jgi:hypothetical protein
MMNVIISEGLVDQAYVDEVHPGLQSSKARAAEFQPERVAKITGIPEQDILEAVARVCDDAAFGNSPRVAVSVVGRRDAIAPSHVFRRWWALRRHVGGGTWKCRSGSSVRVRLHVPSRLDPRYARGQ